jgi:catechol 2,3-dioxygenase-like lactoylglutathione lyase family enzyme
MSKPLLTAIHHVALICSDYPRSRAFYSETLGLPIVHMDPVIADRGRRVWAPRLSGK